AAEGGGGAARLRDPHRFGHVGIEARRFGTIEGEHLIHKVADQQAFAPGAVPIAGVDSHAAPRQAGVREGDAGGGAALTEGAVVVVAEEEVPLRVVGEGKVRPAVVVEVAERHAERLAGERPVRRSPDARRSRDAAEGAARLLVVEVAPLRRVEVRAAIDRPASDTAAGAILAGAP